MPTIIQILAGSGFLIGVFAITLSTIIIRRKTRLYWFFTFWCLAVAVWSLAYAIWLLSNSPDTALFWVRILSIGSTLIPIFHLHCILIFLNLENRRKFLLVIGYSLAVIFLIFNFSPLFVRSVEYTFGFPYWPKPGFLYHIYLFFYFIPAFIYSFIEIFRRYQKSRGQRRAQMRYVFMGVILGVIAGSTNFPLWYNVNIPPYANPLVIVYMTAYAYAIFGYRLLDIRIIFRRGFLRLILAAFAYGTFYGALWFFEKSFGSAWVAPALITGIFIALAFAIAWPQIEKLTVKFSNKFLYASIYDVQETINKLTNKLTTIIDLKEVITLIIDAMLKVMGIERAGILLKSTKSSRYLMAKVKGFDKTNGISLVRDNYLTQWLENNKKALVLEELALQYRDSADKEEKEKIRRLEKNMERIQAKLVLPLISQNKIFGLIVLGNKRSGDAYTVEDIKLLETLANQAAIAIENARLYNNMQEIVAEQTKDLKRKNIHLQKLLKMRSEFLNIASHQLRTPISVIKGNIAELLETIDTNAPQNKKDAYQAIRIKTEKLVQIISDILYSAELDTGAFDLSDRELDKIELVPYLKAIIKDHEYQAREKNINLKLVDLPKEPVFAYASEHYLEVILDNLIINALTFTKEGGRIEVDIKPQKETVRIEIKDNGIGIPTSDQKELFQKFKRAKNANTMHTDGSGLGLFIVKKMIKAHPKGAYGFKSQEGKGSTFWIEIKRVYA